MANLPRLAHVTVSRGPGGSTFIATLVVDDDDCVCTVEVGDVVEAGYVQSTLIRDVLRASPKHVGLTSTAQYDLDRKKYTVSFELAGTAMPEGVEIIMRLFGTASAELEVVYWYFVDSGSATHALLGVQIGPEPHTVMFTLPEGDERSTEALWQRFEEKIADASTEWSSVGSGPDHAEVTLTTPAWQHLDDVLPRLVGMFSFA